MVQESPIKINLLLLQQRQQQEEYSEQQRHRGQGWYQDLSVQSGAVPPIFFKPAAL